MTHPCLHYEFNEAWVYSADGDLAPETNGGRIETYSEKYPSGKPKATWSARICPNGRYLLDGVETHYYESGKKQWEVTWASGRRTGDETLWASNGDRFWSWKHDLTNTVSTWTHWWSNGQRRLESSWDTNPVARDLPIRHFRGLVANGAARHWDANGQEVGVYMFVNGSLNQTSQQPATRLYPESLDAQ
jgi:antitoxin component YwqK of YwqJK toxin-antitoxin module